MFKKATCCCFGIGLGLVVAVVAYIWIAGGGSKRFSDIAAAQRYLQDYSATISNYGAKVKKIEDDPDLRNAVSSAQKHAEHIRQMKQVVEAQEACERELKRLKAPPNMQKVQDTTSSYFHSLGEDSKKLLASLNKKDVPSIDQAVRSLNSRASSAASDVDHALSESPYYVQGKQQARDLWSRLQKQMDQNAPPERAGTKGGR